MKFDKFICPISGKSCSEKKEIFIMCIGGEFDSYPLCDNCSLKIRQDYMEKENISKIRNFMKALSSILENSTSVDLSKKAIENCQKNGEKSCPECESSFEEIIKNSKMGCPHCLHFFKEELEVALALIDADKNHLGNLPTQCFENFNVNYFEEIKRIFNDNFFHLNEDMNDAAVIEDYELAATIRDCLKTLRDCLEKAAFLKEDMKKAEEDLNKEEVYLNSDLLKGKIVELENKFLQMKDIWRLSQRTIASVYGDGYKK